jgi:ferric-dicitrate binding protein FerR (iron transport regulator)
LRSDKTFEERLDESLKEQRLPFNDSKAEAWQKVSAKAFAGSDQKKSSNRIWYRVAIAASVILFVMAFFIYQSGEQSIANNTTGVMDYTLPDGSSIALKQGSAIEYNDVAFNFKRDIDFNQGEAFFEVEKGNLFTVHTSKGDVEVLGTSFNVSVDDDQFLVACKTGSVGVKLPGADGFTILKPGNKLSWVRGQKSVADIDIAAIDNWRIPNFRFNDTPLKDVFERIEAQTGFAITSDKALKRTYTGEFAKSQDIESILEIVCKPMGLSYEINRGKKAVSITNVQNN